VVESKVADHWLELAQQRHRPESQIICIYYNPNIKKSQMRFSLRAIQNTHLGRSVQRLFHIKRTVELTFDVNKPLPNRVLDQLRPAVQIQLCHDVRAVPLNGLDTDRQFIRDLLITQSVRD
jgi:hypothetical protein